MRPLSCVGWSCLLSLGLAGLAACGSAAVDQPGPAPVDARLFQDAAPRAARISKTTPEAERASAEAWLRALNEPTFGPLATLLDVDGDFFFPGMSDATDRAGTLKALGELFGPFTDRKLTPLRVWQLDSVVVLEWGMAAVQSGEWLGVKPTQKPVSIHGLSVLWFDRNGLINDTHCYFDVGAVVAQFAPVPKSVEPPGPLPPPSPTPVIAQHTEGEKKNVGIVNASWDALEAKNVAGYLAPMADDIEVFHLDHPSPDRGIVTRKGFYKWITGGLSGLSQTPTNAWGIGSFVIEEYILNGSHSGKITDAPATGHTIRLHLLDIDELKDGKIVRTWTFGNSFELLAQTHEVERATPGNSSAIIK